MARAGTLRKFQIDVVKPNSGSDTRLVPAASATVSLKFRGFTANETKTLSNGVPTTLAIHDPANVRVGDTVAIDAAGTSATVVSFASRTSVTLTASGADISVTDGDRLAPTNRFPAVWARNDGTEQLDTSGALTANASGMVEGHVYESSFDYIVSGTGITTTYFRDLHAGQRDHFYDVTEYGAVGDGNTDDEPALNALFDLVASQGAEGGRSTIYFPRGIYEIRDELVINGENWTAAVKNLRVYGDPGATIQASSWAPTGETSLLRTRAETDANENFEISGLIFDGNGQGTLSSTAIAGIRIHACDGLSIHDCQFLNFGPSGEGISNQNDGIYLGDDASGTATGVKRVRIRDCKFNTAKRNGISVVDGEDVLVEGCDFEDMNNAGTDFEPNNALQFARNMSVLNCTFKNCTVNAIVYTPGGNIDDANYPDRMDGGTISGNSINGDSGCKFGVLIRNWQNLKIDNNRIYNFAAPDGDEAVGIDVRSCIDIIISNNDIYDITTVTAANYSAAIRVNSSETVQSERIQVLNNICRQLDGNGIQFVDVDGGSIIGNTFDDYDNSAQNRDGIAINQSGSFDCRYLRVIGNQSTNGGGTNQGIDIDSSVTDILVALNILIGNNAPITDAGTRTHVYGNITSITDISSEFTAFDGGPVSGSSNDGWVGQFTASVGTSTVVSNANIRSATTRIIISPRSANAATFGNGTYVSAVAAGEFTLTHTNQVTQTFDYMIINS